MDLLVYAEYFVPNWGSLKQVYINMEPQNGGLEDEIPFQRGHCQVPAVSFRGSSFLEVFLGMFDVWETYASDQWVFLGEIS